MKDFILNGGLFGVLRGYDHKKEGRPYGFGEFGEDALIAIGTTSQVLGEAQKGGIVSGRKQQISCREYQDY